jgi:serine/threonine-protein kinase
VAETSSIAAVTFSDPRIEVAEISLSELHPSASLATPSSAPTVAVPRGRPRPRPRLVLVQSGTDEDVLSSRDFLPPSSHGVRARPSAPVADPLIGRVVADRYRILEPLGRGGMGVVYKVEHTRIGKLLAMKLLAGELSQSPEVVRRFKREALTVSKLHSPNTVQVFDFGTSDGLTYLVMELVCGENLGRVLATHGPIPFARLGKIVVQICSSLAEAHQKGIVHRDIKPENVMILAAAGGADVAKVLDFGLAKLRETEALNDITGQGIILGTPYYMAPEQIRGEPVDPRADVYAVGALMYRLLTGHHPFSGTPTSVLTKHLAEIPIPPAERAPELGIPLGVSRLVMRALAKSPADRFRRIEDMQKALIDEVRAAGSSSVESLLDSTRLRRLVHAAEVAASSARRSIAPATRDEVDAYERKLRRQRTSLAMMVAGFVVAAGAAASFFVQRGTPFAGVEIEPNNTAAEATPIPLGQTVTGRLGPRLDATHGDRDFYAFDVSASEPGGSKGYLKLRVGALPNLPMCTMLYKPGFADALGQYCVGRPGRDLVIPALQVEPGRYLVAVLQDLDPYGGPQPFVHENVSDTYAVLAESTIPEPGSEIEPNDQVASATQLSLSVPVSAAIGWARDEDVFCVPGDVGARIRWKVRDGYRDGGVLEATPVGGVPVRIHAEELGKRTSTDVVGPWQSGPVAASGSAPRCLRVRLVGDPWSSGRATPAGSTERYVVEAEAVP